MSCQPTRRGFLQTAGIIAGSLFLPRLLFAAKKPDFFFIHADTGSSWPVADPVLWCLENARQPILERAKERLLTLTPADSTRIIRLVARRCRLNLLELQRRRVVVHYWGPQGLADLRPFFKAHCLARKDIEVVVRERKREIVTGKQGDDFLYGDRIGDGWPLATFLAKWQRRFEQEQDDCRAAPCTRSGYAWEGFGRQRHPLDGAEVGMAAYGWDGVLELRPTLLVDELRLSVDWLFEPLVEVYSCLWRLPSVVPR